MELEKLEDPSTVRKNQDSKNGKVSIPEKVTSFAIQDDPISDDSDERPAGSGSTYHKKATVVSAILASLTNIMAYSIIAVFYPIEAKERGVSETVIGLIFASYSISTAVGSPIIGKIIPIAGARFVFLAGSFITGGCNILFGFIIDMPTTATFTVFSFAIRILEGIGAAASLTATTAIVAAALPDDVGKAVSLIEMTNGVSYALGPALGGFLYNAGGFPVPFFVLGGIVLAINAVNFFLMPEQGNQTEECGSVSSLLSIPAVWIALFVNFIGFATFSSLEPTFAIYLEELDFTVIQISLLFVTLGLAYGFSSVVCGVIADSKKCPRALIAVGECGGGLLFLLFGLSELLKSPAIKVLAGVLIVLSAAMLSLLAAPSFIDMLSSAEWYGIPSGLGLTSLLSGLWNSAYAVGGWAVGRWCRCGILWVWLFVDNHRWVLFPCFGRQ
ncbi:MFS-type transporter SLC18B1-like isoform X2 [Acanthaster planci]|uniref:MFS-type transporter SLC18B1-like isoform X2 n=1 Tax=Acanthaster planci TaxID=133434 RepID=A0A8B7ZCN3_ACAPL|nr:MFS-type transporter SLC18B1-like isoform X2 [Acanthaster planci]